MDKFDRIQNLHRIFLSHRFPVPISQLAEKLECSAGTAKNAVDLMRDHLNAPLVYDIKTKGWHYDKNAESFELPGLWLTANELNSLSAVLHILTTMDEGLLDSEVTIIQQQVEKLLKSKGIETKTLKACIKYISTSKQTIPSQHFSTITEALIHKHQLTILYSDYRNQKTRRTISPLQLIHYRENWYLDAYCHKRNALRSFMLARITKTIKADQQTLNISEQEKAAHYQASYGIFAGEATTVATLKFSTPIAHEAAAISWHPEQKSHWENHCFIVSIPYNDDRELIRDILKYGPNVEVLAPDQLRQKIKAYAEDIAQLYKN